MMLSSCCYAAERNSCRRTAAAFRAGVILSLSSRSDSRARSSPEDTVTAAVPASLLLVRPMRALIRGVGSGVAAGEINVSLV